MVKLATLVERINSHYELDLTEAVAADLTRKLRVLGFSAEVENKEVSAVVDNIFNTLTREQSDAAKIVHEAYNRSGGPRLVVSTNTRPCPRCKGPMRAAQLHTREMCDYCPKCKVARVQ